MSGSGTGGFSRLAPDAFAVCAYILQKSGAYIHSVRQWPPESYANPMEWAEAMGRLGKLWRDACASKKERPREIQSFWQVVIAHKEYVLAEVLGRRELCDALIQLVAVADEACAGVGVLDPKADPDSFDNDTARDLHQRKTLCRRVDPSLFRVLPKMHTPQSGITIRSLTHHVALCAVGEVSPEWHYSPRNTTTDEEHSLHLLLVPWPREITPLCFTPAKHDEPSLRNMPTDMAFFSYDEVHRKEWPSDLFKNVLRAAIREVGTIDGVILPELALRSDEEFQELLDDVREIDGTIFAVAGVGGKIEPAPVDGTEDGKTTGKPPKTVGETFERNRVLYSWSVWDGGAGKHEQRKHHRWRLDEAQIRQYGLAHRLDPYKMWWENTEMGGRELSFHALGPWLTFALLVCEDLARQDPVADVIRAVGPNLIIALLMDGPQLQNRWPGRYATVFADDPGTSVLSLTSIGMVNRCSPPPGIVRRPVIALWKDGRGGMREIELPEGADAVVLTLNREYRKEWTSDGRHDGGSASYLTFGGTHPIKL